MKHDINQGWGPCSPRTLDQFLHVRLSRKDLSSCQWVIQCTTRWTRQRQVHKRVIVTCSVVSLRWCVVRLLHCDRTLYHRQKIKDRPVCYLTFLPLWGRVKINGTDGVTSSVHYYPISFTCPLPDDEWGSIRGLVEVFLTILSHYDGGEPKYLFI